MMNKLSREVKENKESPSISQRWRYNLSDDKRVINSLHSRMAVNKPISYEELGELLNNICKDVLKKPRKWVYWRNEQIADTRKHCISTRRSLTRGRKKQEVSNRENEQ